MNKQYCKLIMVTPDNNNKYYEMTWNGGSTFTVKYGRVESTTQTGSYPYSKWNSKYSEKIRKGYKDVTDFVTVDVVKNDVVPDKLVDVKEKLVNEFLILMKKYTDNLVSTTYSVKADAVSQKQIDAAQKIIDELNALAGKQRSAGTTQLKINELLVDLYTVIPRRMGHVSNYILPNIKLENTLQNEQDNLDAMAAQVSLIKPKTAKQKKTDSKASQTILDKLGITDMKECKGTPKEVEYLVKQNHGRKINAIFELKKPSEDSTFEKWMKNQKDKSTRILIHGTRCTSVIPILEIGLKIRPVGNFQFSGKAYGDGNYFSEHMQKSLNYTGGDSDKVILVYEVHTGNPFTYDGWFRGNSFNLNYKELSSRGYDSTYVKAGHGLMNSEIIAYKEEQCRIKYIIWLK